MEVPLQVVVGKQMVLISLNEMKRREFTEREGRRCTGITEGSERCCWQGASLGFGGVENSGWVDLESR